MFLKHFEASNVHKLLQASSSFLNLKQPINQSSFKPQSHRATEPQPTCDMCESRVFMCDGLKALKALKAQCYIHVTQRWCRLGLLLWPWLDKRLKPTTTKTTTAPTATAAPTTTKSTAPTTTTARIDPRDKENR